jgi:hypothetical protein
MAQQVEKAAYRRSINWGRLFGEGARMDIRGYLTSTAVEDLDDRNSLVVLMIKVPRDQVAAVRSQGVTFLDIVAKLSTWNFPGIIPWLTGAR